MKKLLTAIDAYMLRLFGTHAELSDPTRIEIYYAVVNGSEYELLCDAEADPPLIIEAVDGEITDVSHLGNTACAVEWFDEAERDQMFDPSGEAVKKIGLDSRRAG